MAFKSAIEFIERVRRDTEFRRAACVASLDHVFSEWLAKSEYAFTVPEIQDAFRSMLLKCQDEEAAEEVKELRCWFSLLSGESEDAPPACGSCAQQGDCGGSCH